MTRTAQADPGLDPGHDSTVDRTPLSECSPLASLAEYPAHGPGKSAGAPWLAPDQDPMKSTSQSRRDVSPAPESVLTLKGLGKSYPSAGWVVRDINLDAAPGELLTVLGPSGCGKTTLLRLIAGFDIPSEGEIHHRGHLISNSGWALAPERRRIGMVFQEHSLFPHLTVRENVQFGLHAPHMGRARRWLRQGLGHWRRGGGKHRHGGREASPEGGSMAPANGGNGDVLENGERHQQPHSSARSFTEPPRRSHPLPGGEGNSEMHLQKRGLVELMEMCGLGEMTERYPHELSGGQQQRVALARALAVRPRLVLLDEPFSNLDSSLRARLRDEVRSILKSLGATAILVTHDQEEAFNMGDRLAVMSRGRLEQVGVPEEVLHQPVNRFVAGFVGLHHFLPGTVADGSIRTELGEFPLPPEGARATEVDVLLRPHQIVPAQGGEGVTVEVVSVKYSHGAPLYTLALPSGRRVEAFLPGSALKIGDRPAIRFEPSSLVFFPAE